MSRRNVHADAKRPAVTRSAEKRNSLKTERVRPHRSESNRSNLVTQDIPVHNPQSSLTTDSVCLEEDLARKGSDNKQERNWLCCREDISPDQPLPGISTRSMLPLFCAHMVDQHGPSYRPSVKHSECPSADQNLRLLRDLHEGGNSKFRIATAATVMGHVMEFRKHSHVVFLN